MRYLPFPGPCKLLTKPQAVRFICCQSVSKWEVFRAGYSFSPWQAGWVMLVKGDADPFSNKTAHACPALSCQMQFSILKDQGLAHLEKYLKWNDRVTAVPVGPAACNMLWKLNILFLGIFFLTLHEDGEHFAHNLNMNP